MKKKKTPIMEGDIQLYNAMLTHFQKAAFLNPYIGIYTVRILIQTIQLFNRSLILAINKKM